MINIQEVDALIFDFDGVLTDNGVYVNESGCEQVRCSRADGLAFDVFRKLGTKVWILSTEKNRVVSKRAKKLNTPVLQGVKNKVDGLNKLAQEEGIHLSRVLYVGNDLNDYHAMQLCGYSACPADSHPVIKGIAKFPLITKGGMGIAREIIEDVLGIDIIKTLYVS